MSLRDLPLLLAIDFWVLTLSCHCLLSPKLGALIIDEACLFGRKGTSLMVVER